MQTRVNWVHGRCINVKVVNVNINVNINVSVNALRNILKEKYENYENARNILKIETLTERRENLIKAYAKKCLQLEQTRDLFPLNDKEHEMRTRNTEKYKVLHANTERLRNSTVPYIQRVLNTMQGKTKWALTHSALCLVKSCWSLLFIDWLHDY